MKTLFTLILPLGLLLATACSPPPAAEQRPPNVIFIMADDLGYGDLGAYGQQLIPTPALDRLAAEGLRFTQVYTGSPVCAPSRSVLMTGQHSGHTRVRGNFSAIPVPELPKPRRIPLAKDDTTVAEVLKQAGYVTGMFGKWGLGEATTSGEPNAQGFDEWFGFLNQRRAHSHYPPFLWHNRDTFHIEANLAGARGQHSHELFTRFALDFLDQHHDTTFFLYLPYCLPHAEFAATDSFMQQFADRNWSAQEKAYAAMVSMIDADVGRILQRLQAYGIDSSTLVFFCSDNGAANRYEGAFDSSGKLRGRKRDMYEGGIRTPMIARMPGTIAAGSESDYPWYFADLLPTLADLAGVEAPRQIDGISVLPAIMGEAMPAPERFMYWEFHERGFDQAVRWKNWKAVRHGLNGALELYDLSVDVGETENVSAAHPEVVQRIEAYLDTARSETPYWPPGEDAPRDAAR